MKLSEIKARGERLEQGDWVRTIPQLDGLALRVRGYGSLAYEHGRTRLLNSRPKREAALRDDPREEYQEVGVLLADTILLDWSGLTDDDGVDIPYSRAKASELLTDPDLRALRDAVHYAALMIATS